MRQVLYVRSKLEEEKESYELEVDSASNGLRSVVCEVRTLEILLNVGVEHGDDRADVRG